MQRQLEGAAPFMQHFASFGEFYPFYLSQHSNRTCRRLHVLGTLGGTGWLAAALITQAWGLLMVAPLWAYGCAWIGHFGFEKNRPAAFGHPLWSLRGDFVMCGDILRGRIAF